MAGLQEAYHPRCRASEASKANDMEYCSDPHTVVILCLSAAQKTARNLSPTDGMQSDKGAYSSARRFRGNTASGRVAVPSHLTDAHLGPRSESKRPHKRGGPVRLGSSRTCLRQRPIGLSMLPGPFLWTSEAMCLDETGERPRKFPCGSFLDQHNQAAHGCLTTHGRLNATLSHLGL